MPEKNKENKTLTTTNGDTAIAEEFVKLLDNLNYEARARAEVEKKSLEITDKDNERNFKLESERIKLQATYFSKNQKNDFSKYLIFAFGIFLFFGALVYFAYKGNMTVIKDVFFPLLIAIISALGGYGYGLHKSRQQQDT